MAIPTLDEIRADLGRWFDGVDGVSDDAWKRLYDFWMKLENNAPQMAGWRQSMKSGGNVDLFRGQAWYEQGGVKMMTLLDDVRSIVAHHTQSPVHLVGKPNLPERFVGRWKQIGVSSDRGETFQAPSPSVEWELRGDGTLATVGDAKRNGWRWAVHEGGHYPDLLLRSAPGETWTPMTVMGWSGGEFELREPKHNTKWRRA